MTHHIRPRAMIGGLVAGVLLCALTPFANSYLKTTPLAGGHFPLAAFVIFFAAVLILSVISNLTKRPPLLSGMELLTAWVLMVVVSGIGFTGLVRTFFINITAPAHFADSVNGWNETLRPLLPSGLYPGNEHMLDLFYNGLPDKAGLGFWQVMKEIPWSFWLPVLAQWGIFVLLCYAALFCLASLFSTQWTVNERINFPLLQMPGLLAEAYDEQRIFDFLKDPFLLCGIAIPVILHTLGGLNAHFPAVPALTTEILAGSYFPPTGFLSGFQKLKIYIYPAFIGFAFIATRQVSLSFWGFFLLAGLVSGIFQSVGLQIPDTALGVMFGPGLSKPEETQTIGAGIVFLLFMFWLARDAFADVLGQCFGKPANGPEIGWIPSKTAFLGFVGSIALLCGWSVYWGMGMLAAILCYGVFFASMLLVARIVCQGGIPYCSVNAAPADSILGLFGSRPFSSMSLVLGMSMQKILFVDVREALLPSLMHAGKVGEKTGPRKSIGLAIAASLLLATAASFVAMLYLGHKYGIQELDMDWSVRTTQNVYANAQRLLEVPQRPDAWLYAFIATGAVVMLVLVLCYYLLPWWPIHPIGYLMAYSPSMRILWFSFLVGWLCNTLCLRYGGTFLYRRLRLFFMGLIIGDFCMGAFWALVSLQTGISYLVLPS